jgi:hypothetical protein
VAELIHAATIAIAAEVPIDRLWHAVPAFPTISEVWLRLSGDVRPSELRTGQHRARPLACSSRVLAREGAPPICLKR